MFERSNISKEERIYGFDNESETERKDCFGDTRKMSNEIIPKKTVPKKYMLEKKPSELIDIERETEQEFNVGDIFLDKRSSYNKIIRINEKGIVFARRDNEREDGWSDETFNPEYPLSNTTEWHYVKDYNYIKIKLNPKETLEEYEERKLQEAVTTKVEETEEVEESTERALMKVDKEYLLNMKSGLMEKQQKFQILERVLERKKYELEQYVREMTTKIRKVMKVIGQIELYLGIHEDIVHIQSGENAEIDEPISFMQRRLYMDEEVGIENSWEQGLDFMEIDQFDEWLVKNRNYEKLIPIPKGVVIMRIRRHDKDYGLSPMANAWMNDGNKRTYILIRNGENIYRIWADIVMPDKLFPTQKEFDDILSQQDSHSDYDKEKAEDKIFNYRQNLVMLQGLIDRTQIFQPLKHMINLFNPETCEDTVRFIRDAELSLTEGKLYWNQWQEKINSSISVGSRIYFSGWRYSKDYDSKRIPFNSVYQTPSPGIYTVYKFYEGYSWKEKKEVISNDKFICRFLPNDEVRRGYYDYRQRKNKVPFYLYKSDEFVLNYDQISLEDIEYYIHNRIDREKYVDMLPVLFGLKKMRLEEITWEKEFVKLVVGRMKCTEEKVWKAIEWWKNKVKWKRPITQDDAKALRMIERRVKK